MPRAGGIKGRARGCVVAEEYVGFYTGPKYRPQISVKFVGEPGSEGNSRTPRFSSNFQIFSTQQYGCHLHYKQVESCRYREGRKIRASWNFQILCL